MTYLLPLLAYLIGSISSAVIVSRAMGLPDPRASGSNNPGATNVLRLGGKKAAIITLVCDALKGFIPVFIAGLLTSNPVILALCGLGAFLGHLYPVFFGFKGGKGVATALGVVLALSPLTLLLLLLIWLVVALTTRYSSLAALCAAACSVPIILWIKGSFIMLSLMVVLTALLIWRHRSNIERLLAGTESRIKFKK